MLGSELSVRTTILSSGTLHRNHADCQYHCLGTEGRGGWVDYFQFEKKRGKVKALAIAKGNTIKMMRDPELPLDDTTVFSLLIEPFGKNRKLIRISIYEFSVQFSIPSCFKQNDTNSWLP